MWESLVFSLLFILYWLNRKRRKFFRKRIGRKTLFNLYRVARNISFMLKTSDLHHIEGDLRLLKKGGVLYSFHFGTWELMPRALMKLGYNLGVVVNRYSVDNKKFFTQLIDKFLYQLRSRKGIKVFYKEDTIKIVRFLNNGGLFGMLVDGNTFYAKFNKAKRLAKLCGTPLIPFAAYQENGKGILKLNCNLKNFIRKRPYDYMWFYKSRGA